MGREGFLGEFEQMLLLAAMRLEDEAYGMRLMEELEISVGRKLSRGSVYVTLERLEDKGWIVSEHSASRPERGGRPRRIIRVTCEGVASLQKSRAALLTLWDGLVVGMAISGGMRLVIVGATIGIVLAGTATWAISGFLFGVQPNDVATFIAIPALLSSIALFAACIPARRASRIDPVRALRRE
jgi:DNA-binding PadR family transcriptional regulator